MREVLNLYGERICYSLNVLIDNRMDSDSSQAHDTYAPMNIPYSTYISPISHHPRRTPPGRRVAVSGAALLTPAALLQRFPITGTLSGGGRLPHTTGIVWLISRQISHISPNRALSSRILMAKVSAYGGLPLPCPGRARRKNRSSLSYNHLQPGGVCIRVA